MGNALLGRNNLTALLSPVLRYGLPQGVLMGYDPHPAGCVDKMS